MSKGLIRNLRLGLALALVLAGCLVIEGHLPLGAGMIALAALLQGRRTA